MQMQSPGTLFRLSVNVTVAVVLLVVGLMFCAAFIWLPEYRESLKYITAVLVSMAVVYSAYYAAQALHVNVERDKVKQSLEFIKLFNEIDVASIRVSIEKELSRGNIAPAVFHAKVVADKDLNAAVKTLIGVFEDASIAVQDGYIDEPILEKSLGFMIPWAAETLAPFISEERRIYSEPGLFFELEKLARSWRNGRYLYSGQSFRRTGA